MIEPSHGGIVVFLVKVDVFGDIPHGIDDTFAFIKVDAFLAVMGKLHCLADLEVAAVRLDNVEQQFDEGGLAYTVVAHDAKFLVAGKRVVEVVEYYLVSEALAHMMGSENLLADVGALDTELHFSVVMTFLNIYALYRQLDQGFVETEEISLNSQKIFYNEHIYIIRSGRIYTIQGQLVKIN